MSDIGGWVEFFENFTYKPNWEFDYRSDLDFDLDKVYVTMRVPDSRRPLPEPTPLDNLMGKRTVIPVVPISKTIVLEPWINEKRASDFLWFHIMDMETHEVGEWFRVSGELVFDPHKEK